MKSVRNALRILEELTLDGPLGVGEIARRTSIAKSTAQRCLETLAEEGWISIATDLGPGALTAWEVSDRMRDRMGAPPRDLEGTAEPLMRELTALTAESTHLITLDGDDVVLRLRVPAPGPVQIVLPEGHAIPAYAAATGKAILAALPDDELAARLPAHLSEITDATITEREAFDAEIRRCRRAGYATNRGEWHRQVVAVAAAVILAGRPVAAVSVSTTPDRLSAARVREIGPQVVATADAIAQRL